MNKAFWRNPASAFFTFAFPLMFLVIFTALLGHGTVRVSPTKVVNTSTYYVAAMASFAVITACYTNIAINVSFQRDSGVLKRTNGTPLPSSIFLGARMVHALFVAVVLVAITAAFGRVLYSADIPTGVTLLRFLVMLLVGAASFCALGFAITSVIPNADASPAIVNASILPLLFLSGVFIPLGSNAPAWIVWSPGYSRSGTSRRVCRPAFSASRFTGPMCCLSPPGAWAACCSRCASSAGSHAPERAAAPLPGSARVLGKCLGQRGLDTAVSALRRGQRAAPLEVTRRSRRPLSYSS